MTDALTHHLTATTSHHANRKTITFRCTAAGCDTSGRIEAAPAAAADRAFAVVAATHNTPSLLDARQVVVTGVDGRPAGRLDEQHGTWTETP